MSYKKVLLVSIPVQDVTRPPAAIPILAACCEQVCAEYQSLDLNLHMHKTLPQSIVNSVKSDFILGIISAETENNFAKIYDFLDEQIDFFEPDLLAISIFTYESIPAGMLLLKTP